MTTPSFAALSLQDLSTLLSSLVNSTIPQSAFNLECSIAYSSHSRRLLQTSTTYPYTLYLLPPVTVPQAQSFAYYIALMAYVGPLSGIDIPAQQMALVTPCNDGTTVPVTSTCGFTTTSTSSSSSTLSTGAVVGVAAGGFVLLVLLVCLLVYGVAARRKSRSPPSSPPPPRGAGPLGALRILVGSGVAPKSNNGSGGSREKRATPPPADIYSVSRPTPSMNTDASQSDAGWRNTGGLGSPLHHQAAQDDGLEVVEVREPALGLGAENVFVHE